MKTLIKELPWIIAYAITLTGPTSLYAYMTAKTFWEILYR